MELTVLERLLILDSMEKQGDIIYLRTRNKLIEKVGLSEEEIKKYEFVQEGPKVKWNVEVPQESEIEISEVEHGMIKNSLVGLNNSRKLTPDHVSLYEKFVENGK